MIVRPSAGVRGLARVKANLFLAIVLAGCGSSSLSSSDGGKDLPLFIGTWVPGSSTITLTCAGQTSTDRVTENTVWQIGTTSDLVQPPDSSGCSLLANVSGRTATALPNQRCTQTMSGITVALTLTTYIFVVNASGTSANEDATGSAIATIGGTNTNCTYAETATYTKSQ